MAFDITQPYSIFVTAGGWDSGDSRLFVQSGVYYRPFSPYTAVTPDTSYLGPFLPVLAGSDGTLTAGGVAVHPRAIVGNRNHFPIYYQTESTNTVINQRMKRTASLAAGWSQVKLTYCGFYQNGGEFATTAAFTLRSAIEYNGVYYPVTFGGVRDKVFAAGMTYIESDPVAGLTLPPGSVFYERVRRIANAAGDSILISTENDTAFGEFSHRGTDSTVDYTLGGEPGGNAVGYFTLSGTTITGIVTSSGGSGYTTANAPVYAFDPDAGTHTGSIIANLAVTAGVAAVGTKTTGLVNTTGWGPNTYPAYPNASGDTTQRCYHAALITGIPNVRAKSLVIVGDSNGAGYGATDAIGDDARNFSLYERAMRNRVGMAALSYPGANASNLIVEATWPLCHAILDPITTHVLWQAGGNDIGSSVAAGAVIKLNKQGAALWRARGAAVSFCTPLPRTTSTDAFVTTANQTPATGFAAAGALDVYTYAIRYGSFGLNSDFGIFEARSAAEDPTTPNVWRVDGGATTTEGSHPSAARGLRLIAASCIVPVL